MNHSNNNFASQLSYVSYKGNILQKGAKTLSNEFLTTSRAIGATESPPSVIHPSVWFVDWAQGVYTAAEPQELSAHDRGASLLRIRVQMMFEMF